MTTPSFVDGEEFREHRQKVVNIIKKSQKNDEGIIFYVSEVQREERFTDGETEFFQDGLFYWLTGWEDSDAAIIIDIKKNHSILYTKKYDDDYEIWHGERPTPESIKQITCVDEVREISKLPNDLKKYSIIHTGLCAELRPYFSAISKNCILTEEFVAAAGLARRIKSQKEKETLRAASQLTADAAVHCMKTVRPGIPEQDVDAEFTYYGMKHGAKFKSFPTIAASGQNSVYLHSNSNKGTCKDGDLLLLDCGLMFKHYAGDITRTFPVNGKFSDDQKLVYEKMLNLQISLIEAVKPGITFFQLQELMNKGVYQILHEIGVAKSPEYKQEVASFFVPHLISHHIGCSCHDLHAFNSDMIPDATRGLLLEPGMEISIEPGIYFHKARIMKEQKMLKKNGLDIDVAIRFADSVGGIRIEDDVFVTENGHEVLAVCPKTVEEIEKIMAH